MKAILNRLSQEEMYEMLLREAMGNYDFFLRLNNRALKEVPDRSGMEDVLPHLKGEMYLRKLMTVFEKHQDYDGYINYMKALDFEEDLMDFLGIIDGLVAAGGLTMAFEVMISAFDLMDDLDIDDSDGVVLNILEEMNKRMFLLIDLADEDMEEEIFGWVCRHVYGIYGECCEESVIQLFMERFGDYDRQGEKVQLATHIIEQVQEDAKTKKEYGLEYKADEWRIRKLKLFMQSGKSFEEIEEVLLEYKQMDSGLEMLVDFYLEYGQSGKAIEVLLEAFEERKNEDFWIASRLRDLFGEMADMERCRSFAEKTLYHHSSTIDDFILFKDMAGDDGWIEVEDAVLTKLKEFKYDMKPYYELAGRYDLILQSIEEASRYDGLDAYAWKLYEAYPEANIGLLIARLGEMAKYTGGRKHYWKIVENIRKLYRYPMAAERIPELIEKWKVEYKGRPAMMEEIGKLKL